MTLEKLKEALEKTGLPVIDPVTAEGLMTYYEYVKTL